MSALLSAPFAALEVGARELSRGRTVTETDVVAFAALTGDRHPLHVDAAWAACGPFGERVAHGLLVLSYAAGLVAFDPARVVALRAVRDAVFKRPVCLGDTIAVETRIAALDPATGAVTVAWLVRNQAGRLVARATVEVLWRREGTADGAPPVEPDGLVRAYESVPL